MRSRCFLMVAIRGGPFLLVVGTAVGQNTTLITLDQAIDLALAHNHSMKASRTLILQNQAQEITANLRPNPTLGLDSQFVPFFSPQDFSGTIWTRLNNSTSGLDISSSAATNASAACRQPAMQPRLRAPRSPTPNAHWHSMWATVRQCSVGGIDSSVRP